MENITLKQALEGTHGILQGISVPMGLFQQIGLPILNAMGNLEEIIGALPDAPAPAAEDQPTEEKEAEERAFGEGEI